MIPAQVRYDPNATPPQFTDNEDYRVEPTTHIRVKIMGTRSEVGEMWAIGTINEDYLGYCMPFLLLRFSGTNRLFSDLLGPSSLCCFHFGLAEHPLGSMQQVSAELLCRV